MTKKLLCSEVVSGNSSDEAESVESENIPGTSWLRKFQANDEDITLKEAIVSKQAR